MRSVVIEALSVGALSDVAHHGFGGCTPGKLTFFLKFKGLIWASMFTSFPSDQNQKKPNPRHWGRLQDEHRYAVGSE